jgi:hypothetical protein
MTIFDTINLAFSLLTGKDTDIRNVMKQVTSSRKGMEVSDTHNTACKYDHPLFCAANGYDDAVSL